MMQILSGRRVLTECDEVMRRRVSQHLWNVSATVRRIWKWIAPCTTIHRVAGREGAAIGSKQ